MKTKAIVNGLGVYSASPALAARLSQARRAAAACTADKKKRNLFFSSYPKSVPSFRKLDVDPSRRKSELVQRAHKTFHLADYLIW